MWNPFKRKKKSDKQQRKELNNLSAAFAIVSEMNRRGLIHWQEKDKILLIEENLAVVELAQGAEGFRRFLEHAAQWQNYNLIAAAYEQQRISVESAAVREAENKEGKVLTSADIQRIRLNARNNLKVIEPNKLQGLIKEFDIMIIRASATSSTSATQENGLLLAVGHYDGEKLEMAMYEDVKDALTNHDDE